MIVAMFLAALLVVALTLAAPVAAQQAEDATEEGGEPAAARAADSLTDAAVTIESPGDAVERIEIAAADCDVEKGATVTVADSGNTPATFVNGDARNNAEVDANIESDGDQIVINGFGAVSLDGFGADGSEDGAVTESTGITCGRAADDDDGGDGDANDNDAKAAEALRDLNCDELLVLFRAEGSAQQYGDASGFADSEVRARIEVCLEREIVEGTAADEDLPDTGGLSLLGLAVLGIVSAAAGLSMIRGGRRQG